MVARTPVTIKTRRQLFGGEPGGLANPAVNGQPSVVENRTAGASVENSSANLDGALDATSRCQQRKGFVEAIIGREQRLAIGVKPRLDTHMLRIAGHVARKPCAAVDEDH